MPSCVPSTLRSCRNAINQMVRPVVPRSFIAPPRRVSGIRGNLLPGEQYQPRPEPNNDEREIEDSSTIKPSTIKLRIIKSIVDDVELQLLPTSMSSGVCVRLHFNSTLAVDDDAATVRQAKATTTAAIERALAWHDAVDRLSNQAAAAAVEGVLARAAWATRREIVHELADASRAHDALAEVHQIALDAERAVLSLVKEQSGKVVLSDADDAEVEAAARRALAEKAAADAQALAAMAAQAERDWKEAAEASGRLAKLGNGTPDRVMSAARASSALARAKGEAKLDSEFAEEVAAAADAKEMELARGSPWAPVGFVLVASTSAIAAAVVGAASGEFTVVRFLQERAAKEAAHKLWGCWVLCREEIGGKYIECASGGVGLSHGAIRDFIEQRMAAPKREARRSLGDDGSPGFVLRERE